MSESGCVTSVNASNLSIQGNLIVSGETTTINTTNTTIKDTLLELNSGLTGANANDSGILIERGTTGNNAFMGWDESVDTFILGTTENVATDTGNLTVAVAPLSCGNLAVTGDLAVSGSARLGFKRYAVYTVDLSTLDGSVTAFTDEDVIFNLGALDVTTPAGITASQIIIEKAIFNVKTVADTALNVKLHLSSDAGTAVNTELENDTEMVGAGATYAAGGSTAADINLNSAAVSVITSNSSAAIAQARLYVVTTTALSANVTQGTVNISVEYSVI